MDTNMQNFNSNFEEYFNLFCNFEEVYNDYEAEKLPHTHKPSTEESTLSIPRLDWILINEDNISATNSLHISTSSPPLYQTLVLPTSDCNQQSYHLSTTASVQPPRLEYGTDSSTHGHRRSKRPRSHHSETTESPPSSCDSGSNRCRKKKRLSGRQKNILTTWLNSNFANPYPLKEEKIELSITTGLTVRQIESWFTRTRQRKMGKTESDHLPNLRGQLPSMKIRHDVQDVNSSKVGSSVGQRSLDVLPPTPHANDSNQQFSEDEDLGPLHSRIFSQELFRQEARGLGLRSINSWLRGLPDSPDEYTTTTTNQTEDRPRSPDIGTFSEALKFSIQRNYATRYTLEDETMALAETSCSPPKSNIFDEKFLRESLVGANLFNTFPKAPSVESGSFESSDSVMSENSYTNFGPRRGRRKYRRETVLENLRELEAVVEGHRDKQSQIYRCSFCVMSFAVKSSWRRHEESTHAPQKEWICGTEIQIDHYQRYGCPIQCPFDYLCPHQRWSSCWQKPLKDRTFMRKDGLVQHLRIVHRVDTTFKALDEKKWSENVENSSFDLSCHVCGKENQDWNSRIDHLAAHYENRNNKEAYHHGLTSTTHAQITV